MRCYMPYCYCWESRFHAGMGPTRVGLPISRELHAKAALLTNWVNSLPIVTAKTRGHAIKIDNFAQDLRDGTVIAAVVGYFAPDVPLRGIQERAVSRKARAHNVDETLNVLRNKTGKPLFDVDGVLDGRPGPTVAMLEAALHAFVVGPARRRGSRIVRWVRQTYVALTTDTYLYWVLPRMH